MKRTFLSVVIASSFASLAIAADAIDSVPAAPAAVEAVQAFSWSGAYGGVTGGYAWDELTIDNNPIGSGSIDFDGARFSGFAGYNFEVAPSIILGAEGDLGYSWSEETIEGDTVETGFNGSARARVGYAFDNALIYAAGGYTATKGKLTSPPDSASETFHGWTVGAGLDYAFTNNIFGRIEYRYNDFGKKNFTIGGTTLRPEAQEHVINVGLGVKF